jgi:arsenate reductase
MPVDSTDPPSEDAMSAYVLWHNPHCSKSRGALDLLRECGIEPEIRDYLWQPPHAGELRELLDRLGITARRLLRPGEDDYRTLGLDDPALDENALIAAMAVHPRLIERPILVTGRRAVIGRPPERVLELL